MKNWKKLLTLASVSILATSISHAAVLIALGDNAGYAFENAPNPGGDIVPPFAITGIDGSNAAATDGASGSLADAGITFDIRFSINAGNTDIGVGGQNIGVDNGSISGTAVAEELTLTFENVTGLGPGRDLKFTTIRIRNASVSERVVINGTERLDHNGVQNSFILTNIPFGDQLTVSSVAGSGETWGLGAVTIEVVSAPEPSSLALLGFGALFLLKRKKNFTLS